MPANIEIKARVRDFAGLRRTAGELSASAGQVIPQEDTFFNVAHGRLKLRILEPGRGQLIYYERPDQDGPKRSDYHISETADPQDLKRVLELAYGIRGIVRKTRYLYLIGQTRVHLDEVDGLGHFMELEVVLRPDQSDADGQAVAAELMTRLGVAPEDLLEGAYMDMLEHGGRS
jgi:predicted adenylyl cyclase CyaB